MTYHNPGDVDNAEEAIARARQSSSQTDRLIQAAHSALAETRTWRGENHFTPKLRRIFQNQT